VGDGAGTLPFTWPALHLAGLQGTGWEPREPSLQAKCQQLSRRGCCRRWEALGKRLGRLEQLAGAMPAAASESVAGQLAPMATQVHGASSPCPGQRAASCRGEAAVWRGLPCLAGGAPRQPCWPAAAHFSMPCVGAGAQTARWPPPHPVP
jgi:hypothetical protein